MNILVVNDDGYQATGIKILANFFKNYGKVYVVAPKNHMSAKSHSITLYDKFCVEKYDFEDDIEAYYVDGTPADCVKIGIHIIEEPIDLVVSGINDGFNLACDIIYSGTSSAALEAAYNGYKAIAFSTKRGYFDIVDDLKYAFEEILRRGYLATGRMLNVNFPSEKSKGIKLTKQGEKVWYTKYRFEDGAYYPYVSTSKQDTSPDSDCQAVMDGYISITPLKIDKTDYEYLDILKKIKEE